MNRIAFPLALLLLTPGLLPAQRAPDWLPASSLHVLDPQTPEGLRQLLRPTGEALPLVSAHRGGALPGFPENCVATFENTLRRTFALLEIDPRYTRDGAIVVHHDATLDRTTTGAGRVVDHTLQELQALRLKDPKGRVTEFTIPTLDEVLEWARGRTVLVLDQKDVPVAARLQKIEQHRAESYALLIVYSFKEVKECHQLNPNVMMEVMIPSQEKLQEFEKTGIPWSHVVAFVGHEPPQDPELLRMLHARGACRIAGTSRNLDRRLVSQVDAAPPPLQQAYQALRRQGVDLIETDLPIAVANILDHSTKIPAAKARFFHRPTSKARAE